MSLVKFKGEALVKNGSILNQREPGLSLSLAEIKRLAKAGTIADYVNVGDIIWVGDCCLRVVDLQEGRYKYVSDNSYTHITFELSILLPRLQSKVYRGHASIEYKITDVYKNLNNPGQGSSLINWLPQEIRELIEPVYIKCYNKFAYDLYNYTVEDVTSLLFLPSKDEMALYDSSVWNQHKESYSYKNNAPCAGFDYYIEHQAAAVGSNQYRVKKDINGTARKYFLRTPSGATASGTSYTYSSITEFGAISALDMTQENCLTICFAF